MIQCTGNVIRSLEKGMAVLAQLVLMDEKVQLNAEIPRIISS